MRKILFTFVALALSACVTPSSAQSTEGAKVSSPESTGAILTDTVRLPNANIDLILEYSDTELQIHKDKIAAHVDDAYVHLTKFFGGPPKKLNGEPYDRLTVKLFDGLGGEADPEWIKVGISDSPLHGFYGFEMTIIHEMFHLWSAETFRYADGQEQWFNEGVGEYFTFRIAAEMGVIPEDQVLSLFSRYLATYLSAAGVGELSLREAGSTQELKQQHHFLVYHGGYVAGLVLDHKIRLESRGQHTLADLMRELYQTSSRANPYAMETLIEASQNSTSVDISDFLHRYVDGSDIILVGAYFDIGMLDIMSAYGLESEDEKQIVLKQMLTFE